MKLKDLAERLALDVLQPGGNFDVEVSGGYAGDLLSDVIGNARERNLWFTCQTHENIVAVAKLKNPGRDRPGQRPEARPGSLGEGPGGTGPHLRDGEVGVRDLGRFARPDRRITAS